VKVFDLRGLIYDVSIGLSELNYRRV
jgi:hypothetical protein